MKNVKIHTSVKSALKFTVLAFAVTVLGGCADIRRQFHYFPDMWFSPGIDAQQFDELSGRAGDMLPPVGAIAYGKLPYKYGIADADKAARELKPLAETNVNKGKEQYGIYCTPCHGETGFGDGLVKKVGKYATIKPLVSPDGSAIQATSFNTAKLFHVITVGQGTMSGYSTQITERNRWFIAQYVKAMQEKKK